MKDVEEAYIRMVLKYTKNNRRRAAETRRQDPNFRLKDVAGRLSIVKDRSIPERLIGVLRELGLE